jgi:protein-disulfide isomerase
VKISRLALGRKLTWQISFLLIFLGCECSAQDTRATGQRGESQTTAIAKLEVYYDLQCGACATFHKKLRSAETRFGKDLSVTFRLIAINPSLHKQALMAARAVLAAHVQGKGADMLDLILAKQKSWSGSKRAEFLFSDYADQLKIDRVRFRNDFESDAVIEQIFGDMQRAKNIHVVYTPSIFLNGRLLTFAETEELEKVIDEAVIKR